MRQRGEELVLPPVGVPQRVLGALAVRDVAARPGDHLDLPVHPQDRDQDVLVDAEACAPVERDLASHLGLRLDDAVELQVVKLGAVRRIAEFQEGLAEGVVVASPHHVEQGAVGVGEPMIAIEDEDEVEDRREDRLVPPRGAVGFQGEPGEFLLGSPDLGLIAHDLRVADRRIAFAPQGGGDPRGPEARAVLAAHPAVVAGGGRGGGLRQFGLGHVGGGVLRREDRHHVDADEFRLLEPQHPPDPFVPARGAVLEIDHEDGVVLHLFDQGAEMILAPPKLLLDLIAFRHVDEAEHHAGDAVLGRAVGMDAREVGAEIARGDFAFDRRQPGEHALRVGDQFRVAEPMFEVHQGTPDVGRDEVEQRGRRRRVAGDAQGAVQEDRGDGRGGHQVVQVAVRLGQLVDLAFQLRVDRRQFLVDRLQLLATRLQLLGRRPQLLVHRLEFFVARLQLLGGRLVLFDDVALLRLQPLEFAFQLPPRRVRRGRGASPTESAFLASKTTSM